MALDDRSRAQVNKSLRRSARTQEQAPPEAREGETTVAHGGKGTRDAERAQKKIDQRHRDAIASDEQTE